MVMLFRSFASCCDKSAAPLGMFGVIVSSSYESIAQGVKEAVEVLISNRVSERAVYC